MLQLALISLANRTPLDLFVSKEINLELNICWLLKMQTQQAEDKKPHLRRQLPLCRSPYGNYPLYTKFFSDILLKNQ